MTALHPGGPAPAALTDAELGALDLTRQLANAMSAVMSSGAEFRADWSEFTTHLHAIQHMIMSQAAARSYPDRFRLLGRGLGEGAP